MRVVIDGARLDIARIASHIVGTHKDDVRIRNTESLDAENKKTIFHHLCISLPINDYFNPLPSVHRENIGDVAVVEPKSGGINENGPIIGVATAEKVFHFLSCRSCEDIIKR